MPAGRAPAKHAPERRCIASGAVAPTVGLLRFVVDPEGCVVADLAEKLPGRGAWVTADRACLAKAVKRRLFSRAFGQAVRLPDDLAVELEGALERRILELIGLCSRAGQAVWGFEKVRAALSAGDLGCLIQAADAAEDGRGKVARLARAVDPTLPILTLSGAVALGRALGREQVVHLALKPGRLASAVVREARRLGGVSEGLLAEVDSAGGKTELERDESRGLGVRDHDDEQ